MSAHAKGRPLPEGWLFEAYFNCYSLRNPQGSTVKVWPLPYNPIPGWCQEVVDEANDIAEGKVKP